MAEEIYIQSNSRVSKIKEDIDEVLDRCNIKLSVFKGDEEVDDFDSKLKSLVDSDEYDFGSMEFAKNMQVDNFENNFEDKYGLRIELLRPDGSQAPDGWTLADYEDAFKVKQNVLEEPITEWITQELFDGKRPEVGEIEDALEELADKGNIGKLTLNNIFFNEVEKPREETVQKIAEGMNSEIPEEIQRRDIVKCCG